VTTRQDLVQLVEENPDNPIACGMLLDQLHGDDGMVWSEAEKYVRRVCEIGRDAKTLAWATQLYGMDRHGREALADTIRVKFGLADDVVFTLLIVPGSGPPKLNTGWSGPRRCYLALPIVTVSARFVLDTFAIACVVRGLRSIEDYGNSRS
jgi:hypothetical protein